MEDGSRMNISLWLELWVKASKKGYKNVLVPSGQHHLISPSSLSPSRPLVASSTLSLESEWSSSPQSLSSSPSDASSCPSKQFQSIKCSWPETTWWQMPTSRLRTSWRKQPPTLILSSNRTVASVSISVKSSGAEECVPLSAVNERDWFRSIARFYLQLSVIQ